MGVSVYSLMKPNSLLGENKNRKNLYLWGIEGLLFLVVGIWGCVFTKTGLRISIQKEISPFSIMFIAIGVIFLIVGYQQRNENRECKIKEYDYVVQATVESIAKDSWYRRNYGNWVHLVLVYHGYDAMGKACDYRLVLEKLKNKKKIIVSAVSVVLVLAVIGASIALYVTRYGRDKSDTEELFRHNISSVNYENTIETAYPQTDIYYIVNDHFKSDLPEGKTEKKAIILGFDGCRADVLTEVQEENSAVKTMLDDGASINLLYCGGVNYPDGENTQATSTAPGWCSLLTGVWADKNGVYGNGQPKNMEHKTLMTELCENGIDVFVPQWKEAVQIEITEV